MAETTDAKTDEQQQQVETIVEEPPKVVSPTVVEPASSSANIKPDIPAPKRKGRPAGSKDKAPRRKAPAVRIEPLEVSEPPSNPEPHVDTPRPTPNPTLPVEEPEPIIQEPPDPRKKLRESSLDTIHWSKQVREQKLKQCADMYTKNLIVWPVA
jgi:hypothetical protein